ncbi:MAG: helix-turn-helix domain-containing protein [Candidatus Margulisiibacteriota bacterium]
MKNYKTETQKDLDLDSQIFKMNDVSKKLKLTPRTIRYYESEGLLGEVKRSIGYTRYFTEKDILRLKEIMAMKKKGLKISEIKKKLLAKYATEEWPKTISITIQDTILTEADIEFCIQNQINVQESEIIFEFASLKYVDWTSLNMNEYLKPFEIKLDTKPQKNEIFINFPTHEKWLGNAMRSIFIYLKKNWRHLNFNQGWINKARLNATEWLVIPVHLQSHYKFIHSVPKLYLVEMKNNAGLKQSIVFQDDIFQLLEKQIKSVSQNVSGLLKQVTVHMNSESSHYDRFAKFMAKIVPHKELLSIEDLSPVYIQSIGSTDAILISTI